MSQKICFKCKQLKDLDDFYKHPQMGDGHLNKCKECTKIDVRCNRSEKLEYYSEYDRLREQFPERREQKRRNERMHRMRNPEKARARGIVGNAIRDGKLTKKPCEFCGNPYTEAHHHDYTKPLDVIWVCFKCHREQFHEQIVTQTDYSHALHPAQA